MQPSTNTTGGRLASSRRSTPITRNGRLRQCHDNHIRQQLRCGRRTTFRPVRACSQCTRRRATTKPTRSPARTRFVTGCLAVTVRRWPGLLIWPSSPHPAITSPNKTLERCHSMSNVNPCASSRPGEHSSPTLPSQVTHTCGIGGCMTCHEARPTWEAPGTGSTGGDCAPRARSIHASTRDYRLHTTTPRPLRTPNQSGAAHAGEATSSTTARAGQCHNDAGNFAMYSSLRHGTRASIGASAATADGEHDVPYNVTMVTTLPNPHPDCRPRLHGRAVTTRIT